MAARKKNKSDVNKSRKLKTLKRQKRREDKSKHYTKIKRQIATATKDQDEFSQQFNNNNNNNKKEQMKLCVLSELEKNVTIQEQTQVKYSPSVLRRVVSGFLFPVSCLVNFSMTKVSFFMLSISLIPDDFFTFVVLCNF